MLLFASAHIGIPGRPLKPANIFILLIQSENFTLRAVFFFLFSFLTGILSRSLYNPWTSNTDKKARGSQEQFTQESEIQSFKLIFTNKSEAAILNETQR